MVGLAAPTRFPPVLIFPLFNINKIFYLGMTAFYLGILSGHDFVAMLLSSGQGIVNSWEISLGDSWGMPTFFISCSFLLPGTWPWP